ncbi:hypothetical protein ACFQ08_38715 [Streptosporangium algeriense]|uniref:Small CPxCG-related zinc finger protein n=1 Tax=Streptosporangium algeriense TaxID=1682748 RepID=A0ABW3E639_9ACTN
MTRFQCPTCSRRHTALTGCPRCTDSVGQIQRCPTHGARPSVQCGACRTLARAQ